MYNLTQCLHLGYNASPCWENYSIQLISNATNGTIPDPLHIVTQNLPWFGFAIWIVTYIALFALFYRSGGREKFLGIAFGGFIASIVYAQADLINLGPFAFSIFIVIVSILGYALIKDSGE